jgi:hypothetical protein
MKSMACVKFLAGSGPQRICTNAILVFELFAIFGCEW